MSIFRTGDTVKLNKDLVDKNNGEVIFKSGTSGVVLDVHFNLVFGYDYCIKFDDYDELLWIEEDNLYFVNYEVIKWNKF